jgi:hypothetical protein
MSSQAGPDDRYFRLLLVSYPRRWRRARRTEEMLGVMLDAAEAEGRTRPTVMESLNVLGHGLRARALSAIDGLGEPLRARVAQFALISGATISLIMLMFGEIGWPGGVRALPVFDRSWRSSYFVGETLPAQWTGRLGPFASLGVVVYAGWVAMVLAAGLGKTAALRAVAMATLAVTLVAPQLREITGAAMPPQSVLLGLAMLAGLVLLAPTRPSSAAQRIGSLLAIVVGSSAYSVYYVSVVTRGPHADIAQSRSCFYWCPRYELYFQASAGLNGVPSSGKIGRGGAAELASLAPWLLLVAVAIALVRWRWERTYLSASAVIALPWLVIGCRNRYWGWSYSQYGIHRPDHWGSSFGPTPRVIGLTLAVWLLAVAAGIAVTNSRRTRLLAEPFGQAAR